MTVPVVDAQPLVDAVRAAVAAQQVAVDVGQKPTVAAGKPWVVMWPDSGAVVDRSLRSRDGFTMRVSFQCFGLSPASALWAVRRVRVAVLGLAEQTVAGRIVRLPSLMESPPPLTRDDDVNPPIWMQYDEARFRTFA